MEEERWHQHILRFGKHPEFDGYVEAVRATIEQPTAIWPSDLAPESNVYFRLGAHPLHPRLYVKVPVSFTSDPGIVSTAMLQADMVQGVAPGGKAIYVNWHR